MAVVEDVAAPTPAFAQDLAGASHTTTRPTPAAAFARARELFRAGERLDMASLAVDVGIARATLYRWTGDRDRLLGDVVLAEISTLMQSLQEDARGTGRARLEQIASSTLDLLARSASLHAFLTNEGTHGIWLLTAPAGTVRPRIVEATAELIRHETAQGAYTPPEDPDLLADCMVSLGERFLHNGGDPSLNPNPDIAKRAIALLLREPSDTAIR